MFPYQVMDGAVGIPAKALYRPIYRTYWNRTGAATAIGQAALVDFEALQAETTDSDLDDDGASVFDNITPLVSTSTGVNQMGYGHVVICMEVAADNAKVRCCLYGKVPVLCSTEGAAAAAKGVKLIGIPATSTSALVAQLTSALAASQKVFGILLEAHSGTGTQLLNSFHNAWGHS